ncbi:MAG: hypothetical protein ABSB22_20285, partial [Thermodesulfobacteriota bacterium]
RRYPRWMARALTARPLRLTRRRKRVLAEVADPAVVLGAVVAAAAIAGSCGYAHLSTYSPSRLIFRWGGSCS